jgi:hypothetical protein
VTKTNRLTRQCPHRGATAEKLAYPSRHALKSGQAAWVIRRRQRNGTFVEPDELYGFARARRPGELEDDLEEVGRHWTRIAVAGESCLSNPLPAPKKLILCSSHKLQCKIRLVVQ